MAKKQTTNNPKDREAIQAKPSIADIINEAKAAVAALSAKVELIEKTLEANGQQFLQNSENIKATSEHLISLNKEVEANKVTIKATFQDYQELIEEKFKEIDSIIPTLTVKGPKSDKVQMFVIRGQNIFTLDSPMPEKEALVKAKNYNGAVFLLPVFV